MGTHIVSEALHTPGALQCGPGKIHVLTALLPNSLCSRSLLLIYTMGVSFRGYFLWGSGEQTS